QAGIKVLQLKIGNIQEMFDALEKIGSATGQSQQAEKVLAMMRTALRAAEKLREDIPANQRRRVFVEISNDPIITAGAGSFVDELITRAGGVNVAGGLSQAYPIINPEMVIEWNPDVIIICYMSQGGQGAGALARRIGWGDITAVRQGRIIRDISNDLLLRPGPRLIEGVEVLARRLYKDQARPVAPSPAGERQTR
ncbi:MAG: cobalamin-binding protein, partial [Planctomycetota bacterium]